ncbi:peptidoglycan DD-metalloendopeptidase family protein [Polaribacter sp. BAL334]|uniref:murein hydrolase activator EnvC family protein n=1 Tax=Polaribacter sp. BAL334 TaxID=1708178 RepID=UPI0018D2577D|nr:peptidoglycan DD-metalloendopeptidase family protein [Polaribacter sp. BAL334]MBG7611536.1 peptidoglycan DD-metalloendopeptidase family protein [Polaribacter sp. BAL334]
MKIKSVYFLFFIFLLIGFSSFGQTRKQLEEQRKKYQAEIVQLNKLLFNEKKKEQNAMDDLKDIKQKIEVRNKLIATIQQEALLLSIEITEKQRELNKLNKKLTDLKADYGDMIYKSYRSKSQQSRLMFILSSQNFYQAYKRLEYMKQYTSFRKKQGEEIVVQSLEVKKLFDALTVQKREKETLLASEEEEKKQMELDKLKQENFLVIIKKKEKQYKKDIQKRINDEKLIVAKIDKLIKEEIEKANRKIVKKDVKATKDEFFLTPAAKALANEFASNKGRLPWPVKEGIVVRKFGDQPHPTFPGITITSSGLHIVTSNGSYANTIFNGEVMNVLVGSGGVKNVLIRHGNFISSYNNLENLLVKKGDKVVTGQRIGQIFTDKLSNKSTLIFVVFKNTTRLNPAEWILPR